MAEVRLGGDIVTIYVVGLLICLGVTVLSYWLSYKLTGSVLWVFVIGLFAGATVGLLFCPFAPAGFAAGSAIGALVVCTISLMSRL